MAGFSERLSFMPTRVDAKNPLAVWRAYLRKVYCCVDIEADGSGVAGHLLVRSVAELKISAVSADVQRIVRTKDLVKEDRVEFFGLGLPTKGAFEIRQRGNEAKAGDGDAFLVSMGDPFEVNIPQMSDALCLSIPSNLLRARIKDVDDLCGRSRFADPVMVSTLRQLVSRVLDTVPRVDASRLQELCLDMIEMMILRSHDPGRSYADLVAINLIDEAKTLIARRLGEPRLSVSQVATACGVSVRQLQNAFQKSDTTFGRELVDARLAKAHELLRSHRDKPRQIGDIAIECGFVNQSHFSTRYRKRFGHPPRDEYDLRFKK